MNILSDKIGNAWKRIKMLPTTVIYIGADNPRPMANTNRW